MLKMASGAVFFAVLVQVVLLTNLELSKFYSLPMAPVYQNRNGTINLKKSEDFGTCRSRLHASRPK